MDLKLTIARRFFPMVFFLLAPQVEAQVLKLIHVGGYYAVKPEQVKEIYQYASYYFSKVNIGFRVKYIPIDYNPCIYKHSLVSREQELYCFKALSPNRKRQITYWMTPPFITINEAQGPQTGWVAGIAFSCGNVSTGNAIERSLKDGVTGDIRLTHSGVVMAHEIFHNLCATHQDSSPNLMHSAANLYTTDYQGKLPILEATRLQLKRAFIKARKENKHG